MQTDCDRLQLKTFFIQFDLKKKKKVCISMCDLNHIKNIPQVQIRHIIISLYE